MSSAAPRQTQEGNAHTCGRLAYHDGGATPDTDDLIASRCNQHQLDDPAFRDFRWKQADECSGATQINQLAPHRSLMRQSESGFVPGVDARVTSSFTHV